GDAVHRSDIGQARRVVGDRTVEDFGDVIGVDAGRGQIDGGVVAQQGGDIVSAQGTAAEFDVSDGAVFQGIDQVAGGEVGVGEADVAVAECADVVLGGHVVRVDRELGALE